MLAGAVALLSHGADPSHRLLAILQIVAGAGLLLPWTASGGALILVAIYVWFSLINIPGMFAKPNDYARYVDFFEEFAVVCGAAIVLAAARFATLARLGMGICAISFAWAQVVYLQFTAQLVPAWIPPNQMFWTILTTVAFALAGVAMLINVRAALAMRLMALMLAFFGLLVWVPQLIAKPGALGNWSEFALNYLIAAAAWTLAERTA
jgi:hypothetical protein